MDAILQNMDVDNKKVLLRVDYNVPLKDGKILDDSKIKASLDTINYLIEHNCKIIIISHLGKIKTEEDKKNNSLEVVAKCLNNLISTKVKFCKQVRSYGIPDIINNMNAGEILMLENVRFEDIPNKLESNCDLQLASYFADLADVFVLDAFGVLHRNHATITGIPKFIPSCIGLLIQKEIEMLDKYVMNPDKPFTIIMGGAKIEDKLLLMNKLLPMCDNMLLTGGIANTFLNALNFNVGESLVSKDEEVLKNVKFLLVTYKDKIKLPYDVIVGNNYDDNYINKKFIQELEDNDVIKDLGNKTLEEYQNVINSSNTIFLNGTAGIYEDERFANGTKELLNILKESKRSVIVGGGDAASAVRNFGYENDFTYISTGGGATLKYIESGTLNGLEVMKKETEEVEVL